MSRTLLLCTTLLISIGSISTIIAASEDDDDKKITLRAAIYPTVPFAFQDAENSQWTGFSIELAATLQNEAAKDNYTLTFVGDGNNIINDKEISGDDALNYISSSPEVCGSNCYDIILGIFLQTPDRASKATFLFPFLAHYLTGIIRKDGAYKTLEQVTSNSDALTCTTETWMEYSGFIPDIVCQDQGECYTRLKSGECDLFAAYVFQAGYRSTKYPDTFSELEFTKEKISDVNWVSIPMSMSLPARTTVMLNRWMFNAYKDGALGDLQEKYFGYRDDDYPKYFPKQMAVSSGIYRNKPQTFQNTDGEWIGIAFDSVDAIIAKAKDDGIDLAINIDTTYNGIVSDLDGELATGSSLQTIAPDCLGDTCHDMLLGAYTVNPSLSELVTFLPPHQSKFLTVVTRGEAGYQTIEQANTAGVSVCLCEGSYSAALLKSSIDNSVSCETQSDCYQMVADGQCYLTVDDFASALVQFSDYPGLYMTEKAVPGTLSYHALPMDTALDPTTKVALTLWQHEITSDIDLSRVGLKYLSSMAGSDSDPSLQKTSATMHSVQSIWWIGFVISFVEYVLL